MHGVERSADPDNGVNGFGVVLMGSSLAQRLAVASICGVALKEFCTRKKWRERRRLVADFLYRQVPPGLSRIPKGSIHNTD